MLASVTVSNGLRSYMKVCVTVPTAIQLSSDQAIGVSPTIGELVSKVHINLGSG